MQGQVAKVVAFGASKTETETPCQRDTPPMGLLVQAIFAFLAGTLEDAFNFTGAALLYQR